jgi:hypothetical protein
MQANREGVFLATLADRSVAPSGPNDLATFIAQYNLISELAGDEFQDIGEQNLQLTGYHNLEQKDGNLNEATIDRLKKATGWDGRDLFWLEDKMPADTVVRLTLEFEIYLGKQKLRIKYIDPKEGGGGGVIRATPEQKTALKNKLGAKLRALGGTPSTSTPKPPQTKPTPPAPTRSQPTDTNGGCSQADAWAAFTKDMKPGTDEKHIVKQWDSIIGELFPGKGDEDMTPADWAKVRDQGPSKFVPF